MRNVTRKHWIIERISTSDRNGGLYIEGHNLHSNDEIHWHVHPRYGWNEEYDTACAVCTSKAAETICKMYGISHA